MWLLCRLFPLNETSLVRSEMQREENVLVTSSYDHSIRIWWKVLCQAFLCFCHFNWVVFLTLLLFLALHWVGGHTYYKQLMLVVHYYHGSLVQYVSDWKNPNNNVIYYTRISIRLSHLMHVILALWSLILTSEPPLKKLSIFIILIIEPLVNKDRKSVV